MSSHPYATHHHHDDDDDRDDHGHEMMSKKKKKRRSRRSRRGRSDDNEGMRDVVRNARNTVVERFNERHPSKWTNDIWCVVIGLALLVIGQLSIGAVSYTNAQDSFQKEFLGDFSDPSPISWMITHTVFSCLAGIFLIVMWIIHLSTRSGDASCCCGGTNTDIYILPLSGHLLFSTISNGMLAGLYGKADDIGGVSGIGNGGGGGIPGATALPGATDNGGTMYIAAQTIGLALIMCLVPQAFNVINIATTAWNKNKKMDIDHDTDSDHDDHDDHDYY